MGKKSKVLPPAPPQAELKLEPPPPPEPTPQPRRLTIREMGERLDEFLPKTETRRTITVTISDDLYTKLKGIAQFRDIPMSHVVEMGTKPLADKLFAEMENDFQAAMRGEKRRRVR